MSAARAWLTLAVMVVLAARGAAQPGVGPPAEPVEVAALAERLGELEAVAADAAATPEQRERARLAMVEVRRRLLAVAPTEDPRRPGWAVEQATALVNGLWRDGSNVAVLYGIPVFGQRQRAMEAAREAESLLRSVDRAEPTSAVLLAGASEDPRDRRRWAETAVERLGPLAPDMTRPPSHDLARALLLRDRPGDAARALHAFEGWIAEHRRLAESSAEPIAPVVLAEPWLGWLRASARAAPDDAAFEAALEQFREALGAAWLGTGGADPLLAVAAADATARALVDRWRRSGERVHLARAFEEPRSLISRDDLGLAYEARRALAYAKMAALVEESMPLEALPPEAMLAYATSRARAGDERRALDLLAALADRPDAGPAAAEALWERAVIGTGSERARARLEGVRSLTALASRFADHPRAREALGAALAHGRHLAANPGEPALLDDAREAYMGVLELAVENPAMVDDADAARLDLARLLLEGAAGADERTVRALRLLERIEPGSPAAEPAGALYSRAAMRALASLWDEWRQARKAHDGPGQRRALARLRPLAEHARDWAERHGSPLRDRFALDHADALTEGGSGAGRAVYERLLPRAAALPGGEARVRLGLARARLLSGDRAGGFAALRALAESLEPRTPRPEEFWHAWALMLETLEADNADGSRTGTIRAHLRRLELLDPALGGEPWATRLRRAGGE